MYTGTSECSSNNAKSNNMCIFPVREGRPADITSKPVPAASQALNEVQTPITVIGGPSSLAVPAGIFTLTACHS